MGLKKQGAALIQYVARMNGKGQSGGQGRVQGLQPIDEFRESREPVVMRKVR